MRLRWVGWMLLGCCGAAWGSQAIDVCFSPEGKCEERIVREIEGAKRAILVQAYGFTSRPIADALAAAQKRGVIVRAILDASNAKDRYSAAGVLAKDGVEVLQDGAHSVANNKVIVIDEAVVLTGSMNFTKAAHDANAENLLIIRDAATVGKYVANWKTHLEHAEAMKVRATAIGMGGEKTRPPAGDPKPGAAPATTVVITENGKRYHRENCETVKGGGVKMSVEEARKKGKTACKRCKPDG